MSDNPPRRPGVGVAVIIRSALHPDCVVLGIRKGSTGQGQYALPGGHLEFGESLEECATRESLEETGLTITNVHFGTVVNGQWAEPSGKRYQFVTIAMIADVDSGSGGRQDPENMEPHKCEGWGWTRWDEFPEQEKLFHPLQLIHKSCNPFSETNLPQAITSIEPVTDKPDRRPGVGMATIITSPSHPGCVLIGARKGSSGQGTYALPGGHLEFGESFDECTRRECIEETGLELKNIEFAVLSNCVWTERSKAYHYIDVVMYAEIDLEKTEEPVNKEPEKCEGWEWREWQDIPHTDKLFGPMKLLHRDFIPFNSIKKSDATQINGNS